MIRLQPTKTAALVVAACTFANQHLVSAPVISDGSDGPFNPTFSQPIALPPNGVKNFTTINIPTNVTVWFIGNASNTPAFLAATGSVVIEGVIDMNARHYFNEHSAGGEPGGTAGVGDQVGQPGGGVGGGAGGALADYTLPPDSFVLGNAGGGGGMSTAGLTATSRTGFHPGLGHAAITRPVLTPGVPGGGGSGGGGGGGAVVNTIPVGGGDGGAGGGAIQISTPGKITFRGAILANGGNAGYAYANGLNSHAGPGGGGAGGNIELYADTVEMNHARFEAIGGLGGPLSYEPAPLDPPAYNCGATGGWGFLFVQANHLSVDSGTVIGAIPNFARPTFTSIKAQNNSVVITGTGGTNQSYTLLSSTNLTLPQTNWVTVLTNTFDASGNLKVTNLMTPGDKTRFYLLRSP